MATNNFKPFAIASGANVISQADYEALSALAAGFQAGKASSAQINKAIRQSTVMAYVLAQFISDSASVDVLDNGVPATILANLKAGLTALTPGRLLNVQVFNASATYTRSAGATKGLVHVVGGGGGGGGARSTSSGYLAGGAGGGGGGFASGLINLPSSQSVVVGAGGAGGADTGDAGNGGASSFGSISATGGGAGASSRSDQSASGDIRQQTGGWPGIGSGGNLINSYGGAGHNLLLSTSGNSCAGAGGSTHYSGAPLGAVGTSGNGSAGAYGAGGSGALSDSSPSASYSGGAGGNGLVIIWEYA